MDQRSRLSSRRRDGSAAVEMGFVAPFLMLVVLGMLEFGTYFFVHHSMLNAAREAARSYAVREMSASETIDLCEAKLAHIGMTFTVTTSPENSTDRERWVQVSCPINDATLTDPLNVFADEPLVVTVSMRRED